HPRLPRQRHVAVAAGKRGGQEQRHAKRESHHHLQHGSSASMASPGNRFIAWVLGSAGSSARARRHSLPEVAGHPQRPPAPAPSAVAATYGATLLRIAAHSAGSNGSNG